LSAYSPVAAALMMASRVSALMMASPVHKNIINGKKQVIKLSNLITHTPLVE
jgi:hypothetical protein